MDVIAFNNDKGTASIVIPTEEGLRVLGLNGIMAKDVPAGKQGVVVKADSLPKDTFRNAWEVVSNRVDINLPKAKTIAHEKRRDIRGRKLKPLDEQIAFQLPNANPQTVEQQRAAIRNKDAQVQADIDKAATADELENILVAYDN